MKIFITGGTGFVGRHIIQELKGRGHEIVALVRRPNSLQGVQEMVGDVTQRETLDAGRLSDCQAVIHLVGIIRQFPKEGITFERLHVDATRNLLWTCHEAGIQRYVHMSALGADPDSAACYHRTKAQAEELVHTSSLNWTIIRPSLILGPDGEFFRMISSMIRWHVVPLIGDGSSPVAPVGVSTVARAFANAMENGATFGKTYELGGEVLSYREMVARLAGVMGKRVIFIRNPISLMRLLATKLDRFKWFPLSRGQINMLLEAKPPADNSIYNDLGLQFMGVEEVVRGLVH